MDFLKCNHCGHMNEVKTEYQSFCDACNKKIDNNFPDWSRRNPNKSFADFRQLICISEADMKANMRQEKPKRKSLTYWIVFFVSFTIFTIAGGYGGDALIKFLKSEKTAGEVLDKEWSRHTYGRYGLSLETPVQMTKTDLNLPDNVKALIEHMDSYTYNTEKGFKVYLNSAKYKPIIGEGSLEGAAEGSVTEMKNQKGVTNFVYTQEWTNMGDIPGFIQRGSFEQDGVKINFINEGFVRGLYMWHIMVGYQANDGVGKMAAERVIASVEINTDQTKTL